MEGEKRWGRYLDKKGVFERLGSDNGLDLGSLNDDSLRIWFGSIRTI